MSQDKETTPAQEPVKDVEEIRENRKLKHFLIKGVFFLISFIIVMSILVISYDVAFREGDFNESLVGSFFTSLLKILEVMFTSL